MKPLYDRYRLIKQILCRASAIPVIVSSVFFFYIFLAFPIHCILVSHLSFSIYWRNRSSVTAGVSNPVSGGPLSFSSAPVLIKHTWTSQVFGITRKLPGSCFGIVWSEILQDLKEQDWTPLVYSSNYCVPKPCELLMLKAVAKDRQLYYSAFKVTSLWPYLSQHDSFTDKVILECNAARWLTTQVL